MVSTEFIIFAALIILLLVAFLFIILSQIKKLQKSTSSDQTLIQWLQSMQQSLNQNNKNINDTLAQTTATINRRLDNTIGVMTEASREVARMNELGQSIKDLQLLLQSPKLRGGIGEEVLADMLAQIFPKGSFFLQHGFKSGAKVDAAIKTTAGLLCIDAKFPMENFQKKVKADTAKEREQFGKLFTADVKKHVKDIASKYILADEGTVDFAFMYVPSETIFYEIANTPEILDFAKRNRVYPVSPNTLYLHLQTILLSFEGQKIEARAKQIMSLLKTLQTDYGKLDDNLQILGKHLNNASNQYVNTSQQFGRLGQKLNQSELLEGGEK
ncbi:DNA recombination protein RmuC [Candidatus Beckwithbacteria bacterium]|nr:DNA recombination protein RmuC [Candidatus Beckwithbacteria bacterium]